MFSSFKSASIESAVAVLRQFASFTSNTWSHAKKFVLEAEELSQKGAVGKSGADKYQWAVKVLLTVFPKLAPGWANTLVQIAWLLMSARGWDKKSEDIKVEDPNPDV